MHESMDNDNFVPNNIHYCASWITHNEESRNPLRRMEWNRNRIRIANIPGENRGEERVEERG